MKDIVGADASQPGSLSAKALKSEFAALIHLLALLPAQGKFFSSVSPTAMRQFSRVSFPAQSALLRGGISGFRLFAIKSCLRVRVTAIVARPEFTRFTDIGKVLF